MLRLKKTQEKTRRKKSPPQQNPDQTQKPQQPPVKIRGLFTARGNSLLAQQITA